MLLMKKDLHDTQNASWKPKVGGDKKQR